MTVSHGYKIKQATGLARGWPLWRSLAFGVTALGLGLVVSPSQAAEDLIISYGILERTIAISDLEEFAATGELSPQMAAYNNQLQISAERLEQIQQLLTAPADISTVAVAQFLYTDQGKILLKQISRVIQTPSRQAGFSALRGALILAAADPDTGLTLLNVLKAYPTEAIRIDLGEGLAIVQGLNRAILQSERAINLVQVLSQEQAEAAPPAQVSELLQLGQSVRQYGVRRVNLVVPGLTNRVELYLPRVSPGQAATPASGFPLVIISHGLGSSSESFAYLASYLATGGFAVAAIEHSGSNDQQLSALLEGRSDAVIADEEFLRRPQDVSLTIDALGRLEATDPVLRGQFDLTRIGLIGQSFGGYTALALAGATFNLADLAEQCLPTTLSLNPSLLLQCQAVRIGDPEDNLTDPRIRSIFVMNPIGSLLFGESGYGQVQVPSMVVASAADTIAPAFPEQIQPFTWLTTPDRYLLLVGQGTHFR
ncbi:MAG: alpha/beta hydrolase [Leptolyngbyaceae cyanobacterium SM2_3_12]|nr:alpha/beta hydrolase [Leptolyngbyaceae cyanobacterium SM2_3_12]